MSSALFFDVYEKLLFEGVPPTVFGYLNGQNEQIFLQEILDFPIGFSFAVYQDPIANASTKPLLWTRGLHRYNLLDLGC